MKKNRKLTPQEVQIYHRQHNFEDILDAEEAKISNEKAAYVKLQKKSKQQLQKQIQSLKTARDSDPIEDDLDIPEEELAANRIIRNARTHKNRLHGLKSYENNDSSE